MDKDEKLTEILAINLYREDHELNGIDRYSQYKPWSLLEQEERDYYRMMVAEYETDQLYDRSYLPSGFKWLMDNRD